MSPVVETVKILDILNEAFFLKSNLYTVDFR